MLSENDGSTPKKTQGKPLQNQTTGPNTDARLTQPQVTTPGETGKTTTASRPDDAPRRVLFTVPEGKVDTLTEPAKPATAPKTPQIQPEAAIPDTAQDTPKTQTDTPYLTTDLWTGELEGVWTDTDAVDTNADSAVTPVRYEDALRDYLGKGTEPTAVLKTNADTEPSIPREAVPKTKEQLISELVPKIRTTNMTPGRALIAAEQMYSDAAKRFGEDMDAALEIYQPGQNPRKFLDGFQNAYYAGKIGNKGILERSGAVAYLTQDQRKVAYARGMECIDAQPLEYRGKSDIITEGKSRSLPSDIRIDMPKGKFTAYALDPQKAPDKAKAFKLALGYDLNNHEELMKNILENIDASKFVEKGDRGHGMRYEYILELRGANGKKANVLTAWISDGEGIRLVTVYITNKDVTK